MKAMSTDQSDFDLSQGKYTKNTFSLFSVPHGEKILKFVYQVGLDGLDKSTIRG